MNKTHKKSFLIAISTFTIGAMLVAGAAISVNVNSFSLNPIKAEPVSRSMTISKDTAISYSSKANASDPSHYDNTIVFATPGRATFTCTITNSVTSITNEDSLGAVYPASSVSFSSSYSSPLHNFQQIDSITIYSASNFERKLNFFFNGSESFETLSVPSNGHATFDTSGLGTVRNFTFCGGSGTSQSAFCRISTIVINYTCDADYHDPIFTSLSVDASGAQTEYTVDDSINTTGLVVTAHFDDSSSEVIHSGFDVVAPDMSTAGEKEVTISYTIAGVTKSDSYGITVKDPGGLSGIYVGDYTNIEFTSSTAGTYIYGGERLYFTYVIDGTKITFTYVSGDNTSFGSYRLFAGGSSPKVNSTGSIVSDSQLSVTTYNMFDAATSRTFTKS